MNRRISFLLSKKSVLFFCFFFPMVAFAVDDSDYFEEGKKLLATHHVERALDAFLKAEKQEPPVSEVIDLYIGVSYFKLQQYNESAFWLKKGFDQKMSHKDGYLYAYNLANALFMQKQYEDAILWYNKTLVLQEGYPPALLNRANALIKVASFDKALADYRAYLEKRPQSPQKPALLRMVSLLEAQHYEAVMEGEKNTLTRRDNVTEYSAVERRYQELQKSLESSLQDGKDVEAVSAGSENTLDYGEDYELE